MSDWERAMNSYESALRHNPYSVTALFHIASLFRGKEQFEKAIEYFKRILAIQDNNGEAWGALGHCYLMMDNLQDAYHAYQQALYHLKNPNDPKLWYGIGILYDRHGSIDHAEEAFSAVMKMEPQFEKANEIYFRLGIIYKQQQKYDLSLQCFRYILHNPPRPLTEIDIWFQTGHVHEQQKEFELAKEAYERVLAENPDHAKVLQQLGWLYHQRNTSFSNQSVAIQYLTRSLKADSNDSQSWYLLGRCYMVEQNYNKAYEAYQQAVYRDARNPTFWCSIGVLYYQINQYRDALDAYSRAIRLNPYISEVWYDLGTLYESCNNQAQDALDAYQRAAELDPSNPHIRQRLDLLRKSNPGNPPLSLPTPQDVNNPYQYQNGPTPSNRNHPTTTQYPSSSNHSVPTPKGGYDQSRMALQESIPPIQYPSQRDLPLLNTNGRHSPNLYTNHNPDVRIPSITTSSSNSSKSTHSTRTPSDRILLESTRSPTKMPSLLRSPAPSKASPRMQTAYSNNRPMIHHDSTAKHDEPLRRTSILYDTEKHTVANTAHTSPPFYESSHYGGRPVANHNRNSSSSSSSLRQQKQKESPIESNAADTLMSMSQQKRSLESEDDKNDEKRTRRFIQSNDMMIRSNTNNVDETNANKKGTIPVSS
ncbi:MAG: hypothetical protein EXX96DRAFT_544507 [Benjaminiella poitrasii]|nr:MAG: hypothetical protein EXX96DRAFT_544507 [Benjaminiella poitrasii]